MITHELQSMPAWRASLAADTIELRCDGRQGALRLPLGGAVEAIKETLSKMKG